MLHVFTLFVRVCNVLFLWVVLVGKLVAIRPGIKEIMNGKKSSKYGSLIRWKLCILPFLCKFQIHYCNSSSFFLDLQSITISTRQKFIYPSKVETEGVKQECFGLFWPKHPVRFQASRQVPGTVWHVKQWVPLVRIDLFSRKRTLRSIQLAIPRCHVWCSCTTTSQNSHFLENVKYCAHTFTFTVSVLLIFLV